MPSFYEFFAGGGMASAGLGPGWTCLFANDFDPKKGSAYIDNWGPDHFWLGDVRKLRADDLPGCADLAWASFPCQDLSLAGGGAGLKGERSGTFWPFWDLMRELDRKGRGPRTIVLENVCGTLTSHGGRDFAAICTELRKGGFAYGAVVGDAALFTPQSRPRVFFVAVKGGDRASLSRGGPIQPWHTPALVRAFERLSEADKSRWIWWDMPAPPKRNLALEDVITDEPTVAWHSPDDTARLLSLMTPTHRAKISRAVAARKRMVGTLYRRTRPGTDGEGVQRAEVRFDGLAGCLRTPAGGSSRQTIVVVDNGQVRSRLLCPTEAAKLMGLPKEYRLPTRYNDAYHLLGDGVAVPVVSFIRQHLLDPLLETAPERMVA